jgi:hypothetical protein
MRSFVGAMLSIVILSAMTYSAAKANFETSVQKAYASQSVRLSSGH